MSDALPPAHHAHPRPRGPLAYTRALRVALGAFAAVALGWLLQPWKRAPSAEYYAYTSMPDDELPELWSLPALELVDHRGHVLSRDSLRGRAFVANFIFTQCTSVCPTMTSRMVQLQRRLAGRDVRFVSFSVDPAHDTVEVLAEYARRWNETESRWSLVATDEQRLSELVAAFRIMTAKTANPDDPIIHSSLFFLVDDESIVRAVYASDDPAAIDRLLRDVERITAGEQSHDEGPGEAASYASLGCAGCHDSPRVAPPLVDLRGAERTFTDGRRRAVDEAYLRRSLLEPGREVVKGYLPLMPGYGHDLTDAELDELVRELLARTSTGGEAPREAELVTDPVCQMRVRAEPSAPHTRHRGHDVHFCSEMCKERFDAAPERYPLELRPKAAQ